MENAFHPDLNTHIGYYYWQIASKGWKIGWKISRFQAYLPAFMLLIMSGVLTILVDMVIFFAYIRCGSQIRL